MYMYILKHLWASATSRRGKAGYVCTLRRDAYALVLVINTYNRFGIDLTSAG